MACHLLAYLVLRFFFQFWDLYFTLILKSSRHQKKKTQKAEVEKAFSYMPVAKAHKPLTKS